MLIPPFQGRSIGHLDKEGGDLSDLLLNSAKFFKVGAFYGKRYEELGAADWPRTCQSQTCRNIFGPGRTRFNV